MTNPGSESCFFCAFSSKKNIVFKHSLIFYTYNCAVSSKQLLHNLFHIDQVPSSVVGDEWVHVQQYSRDCFQSFDVDLHNDVNLMTNCNIQLNYNFFNDD
jgi:hypothetical protein